MSDLPLPVHANDGAEPAAREPYALARRGWTPAARPMAPAQARWLPAATRAATQTLAPRPVWPALPGAVEDEALGADAPSSSVAPRREAEAEAEDAQTRFAETSHIPRTDAAQPATTARPLRDDGPAQQPAALTAPAARSAEASAAPTTSARRATSEPATPPAASAARSAWQQLAAWIDGGQEGDGDASAPTAGPVAQPARAAPGAAPTQPAVRADTRTAPTPGTPREMAARRSEDIVVPLRRTAPVSTPGPVPAVQVAFETPTPVTPPAAVRGPTPHTAQRPAADAVAPRSGAEMQAAPQVPAWPDLSALLAPAPAAPTLRIDHLEVVAPAPKAAEPMTPRNASAAPPAHEAAPVARPAARAYRSPWSTRRVGWD